MDDAALVVRARQGDAMALAQLLQRHYLYVKKYLVTICLDRNLAEDLTQETMIRAIRHIGQYSGRARFTSWLGSIATRVYLDTVRKHRREGRLAEDLAAAERVRTPPAGAGPPADWDEMLDRLRRMPREVRVPIVLKHYYGYEYEEIARLMGIPTGTVKSRIHNGIRELRRGLSGDDA